MALMRADYWTGISLSAAYAGLLSVPALIRKAQELGFHTVEDLAHWQEPMRTW